MRMVTRIAVANMKYHRSKNILTGVAVFLTTLLLFLVPAIGYDLVEFQDAAINEFYPNWHALYRDVSEETAEKLSVHHSVSRWGLRSDLGYIVDEDAKIEMMYMDKEALSMYRIELSEGRLPEAENEIVVSEGILEELSQTGKIGDTISVPYQVYRDGALDYTQEKDFVICGFFSETEANREQKSYVSFVSKAFLEKELPSEQICYHFLFRVNAENGDTTETLEAKINQLAEQFGIAEQSVKINEDYLGANYVDPTYVPAIIIIILIIVAAGVITIYSIYYVSAGARVQEFGRLKAIGATKRQIREIVLLEGLATAAIAIPAGLLLGTILIRYVFLGMCELAGNQMMDVIRGMINSGSPSLYHLWMYLLAAIIAAAAVCLALSGPMRTASKVSEIEAMRYQDSGYAKKGKRKGYQEISVGRLTRVYLAGNKKKSAVTICSMAATGLFFMVVATVLSCADPTEGANSLILGAYEISPVVEFNNKEHPELEWSEVQKDNPLTEDLKEQILQIDGITAVECYSRTYVTSDAFGGYTEPVSGIPESGRQQLLDGIIEGNVTYEELMAGDKVIMDKNMLYWYPDLKLGDIIDVVVDDGDETQKRQLTIAAIGKYPLGFTNYGYLIMAKEGLETFSEYSLNYYYHIFASEQYDETVKAKLQEIVAESGRLNLRTWEAEYEEQKSNLALSRVACYAFLGILGMICIMNMINTMIHSVHVRKKEIGMLQAVGMSDAQLRGMLGLEGLFYTAGTLLVAVGGGSLAGYPVFLWAEDTGMLNITSYHYPVTAAIVVAIVLVIVQLILTLALGKSVKKESLIERIRFSE